MWGSVMISLFLNTSVDFLSVAIVKDGVVLDSFYTKLDNDLSKITLSTIDRMLSGLGVSKRDINEIVCVNGPGSFTGLRIGVTIAKVWAYSLGLDVVCVSSLFAMATGVSGDYIVPIIDARRGFVYAGIYDRDYNVVMDDCYISFDLLKDRVSALTGDVCYVSSSGFNDSLCYVPDIARLFKYLDRSKVSSSFSFVPNYLKRVEAEEKLNG
jgi:tRNA threonylcarbamoyladenosine biosynthesis protein TsaB